VIVLRNVILAVTIGGLTGCSYMNGKGDADEYAQTWVTQNIPANLKPRFQCMSRDTDDNGYVSCTVSYDTPDGTIEMLPIECGVNKVGTGCGNEGCKPMMPVRLPGRR
jgi:hypothetical protein